MDLGQQSNLGSLISAVLVGLLALASNQYARMDRQALKSFVDGINVPQLIDKAKRLPEAEGPVSVTATEDQIRTLEARFSSIFEQWKEGRIPADDADLKPLWKSIQRLKDRLDGNAELRDALSTRARVNYVWILFRAAEMNPNEFSSSFVAISENLAREDDETVRAQAAVLRIYHGYDPRHPDVDKLSAKLEGFASDNLELGVFLYLIVSHELYDIGNRDAAAQVLRRGIQVYSKFPTHVGRIKLINELMDQQMGR